MAKRIKTFVTGSKRLVQDIVVEFDTLGNSNIAMLEAQGFEVCGEIQPATFATEGNGLYYGMGVITYETEPVEDYDDKKK